MSAAPDRLVRVNELLKREIADFLEKDVILKDCGALTTVVDVSVSCDLRAARVNVSIMGSREARATAVALLHKARPAIQRCLAKNVAMKFTPVLHFKIDDNIQKGDNVLALIQEMEKNNAGENQ